MLIYWFSLMSGKAYVFFTYLYILFLFLFWNDEQQVQHIIDVITGNTEAYGNNLKLQMMLIRRCLFHLLVSSNKYHQHIQSVLETRKSKRADSRTLQLTGQMLVSQMALGWKDLEQEEELHSKCVRVSPALISRHWEYMVEFIINVLWNATYCRPTQSGNWKKAG